MKLDLNPSELAHLKSARNRRPFFDGMNEWESLPVDDEMTGVTEICPP